MNASPGQTYIRIDLNTLFALIGIAAVLVGGYFIIKKITSVPGDLSKKVKGLFGRRSAVETLQKQVLQLQEENDRLTLEKLQAQQQLEKVLRNRQEQEDALLNAKSELEDVKTELAELQSEYQQVLEYCKDLRRRISIGAKQARKESIANAAGLVKMGVGKSISMVAGGVTGGIGMLSDGVVKVNAKIAETVRSLPRPLAEDDLPAEYSEEVIPADDSYEVILEEDDNPELQ